MSKSIVLVGATTINGILCRAARTAALYVPICNAAQWMLAENNHVAHLVGSVTVPSYAIGTHHYNHEALVRQESEYTATTVPTASIL